MLFACYKLIFHSNNVSDTCKMFYFQFIVAVYSNTDLSKCSMIGWLECYFMPNSCLFLLHSLFSRWSLLKPVYLEKMTNIQQTKLQTLLVSCLLSGNLKFNLGNQKHSDSLTSILDHSDHQVNLNTCTSWSDLPFGYWLLSVGLTFPIKSFIFNPILKILLKGTQGGQGDRVV